MLLTRSMMCKLHCDTTAATAITITTTNVRSLPQQMWAAVDAATAHVTSSIFSDPASTAYGLTRLTFEEFGNWYNSGGYKQVTVICVTVFAVSAVFC
jgi:hypothetical protein